MSTRTHRASLAGGINSSRRRLPGGARYPSGRQGNIYAGGKHGYRKEERRARAQVLQEERATRTPEQQLELLNTRPGSSGKERRRLMNIIANRKKT